MNKELKEKIPENIQKYLDKQGVKNLRPAQEKSINKGIFENNKNQIICAPTASGKTLVSEFAFLQSILNKKKKAIYVVPLKALASEKYKEFVALYGDEIRVRISIGELQTEKYNYDYDLLIVTAEKLDSLIRHNKAILENLGVVIIDEIHLLNDEKRGPTLEVLLSIFRAKYPRIRLVGLSATIGNSKELAAWLRADLIEDDFRPVELQQYILHGSELKRYK